MAPKAKGFSIAALPRQPLFWLLFVLVLGGAFRFYNPNWDFQESFHPDERNILGAVDNARLDNGFRVTFFAYGQLPVYLYLATGALASPPQSFVDLFSGTLHLSPAWARGAYYLLLLIFIIAVLYGFSRKDWKLPALGLCLFSFALVLLGIFSNVFILWFSFLEDQRIDLPGLSSLFHSNLGIPILPLINFFLVGALTAGVWALLSGYLGKKWADPLFYACTSTVFILGLLPSFLPEDYHLPRLVSAFAFLLLVAGAGAWLAWASRGGRIFVALLSLWAFFASLRHGSPSYMDGGSMMIIGRQWSAVFSTLTIGALYLLVKRLYQNAGLALLAAAFFAFTTGDLEQAHYCITESFTTFMFVVMALLSGEMLREGSWKNYLAAGAAFGLAMAAKTSNLYFLLMPLTAHLILLSRKTPGDWEKEGRRLGKKNGLYGLLAWVLLAVILSGFLVVGLKLKGVIQDLYGRTPLLATGLWLILFLALAAAGFIFFAWGAARFKVLRPQVPQWLRLAAAYGLAFFIFFLLCPWSLLDSRGFMERQNYEWDVVSHADICYVLQFKDTPRYWFQLKTLAQYEMGWPLGIAALLGMLWMLGRLGLALARPVRKGGLLPLPFLPNRSLAFPAADLLVLCWFIPYFAFIGSWNTKFIRYMVPTYPAFCLFAALLLFRLFQWAKSKGPWGRFLKPALLTLSVGYSFFYSAAYMHVYRFPHPWIESSVWIFKNLPFKSVIGTEIWGDGLPKPVGPRQDPRMDKFMTAEAYYGHADLNPYETFGHPTDDSQIKKDDFAKDVEKCDYISLDSKKIWYTLTDESPEFRPHGFNNYPVTSRYYRLLWSGQLGFQMVGEFHNFPSLFGVEFPDDGGEETFSVYDHPRAYFFKKVRIVPRDRILKLLGSDDYVEGIDRDLMRTITPANVEAFIAQRNKYLEEKGLLN
jgi:hypothetical protein